MQGCSKCSSFIHSVRGREREEEVSERERKREERERGREKEVREREREKEGERERKRKKGRVVEYCCFIFIFKGNDGCLGTFKLSSIGYCSKL